MKLPKALSDLKPRGRGRAFVTAVLREYELSPDAFELLAEAGRMLDEIDRLAEIVDREGLVLQERTHPAQVERRLLRTELRLVLTRLGFPDVAGEPPSSRKARMAAEARWSP